MPEWFSGAGWLVFYMSVWTPWVIGRPQWWWLMRRERPALLRTISNEIHPFMPALFLADGAQAAWGEPFGSRTLHYGLALLCIVGWWFDQGDDDDRWKKRRKKLAEKIRSLGHRLVVATGDSRG